MTTFTSRKPTATAMFRPLTSVAFMLGVLFASGQASAQQPGTAAVVSMTLPSSAEPVKGWSVKRGLLGRPVYASAEGKQIGTVVDLVVTLAAAPYVLVIGVGGFVEIGGHEVAVPLDDVVEQGGLLIFPGATRASLKAMPLFPYSNATMQRAQFMRAASAQLTKAHARLVRLQKRATAETGAAKVKLENDNAAFQADITTAEETLADLENAEAAHWVMLQKDVQNSISRVRAGMSHHKAEPATPAPGHP